MNRITCLALIFAVLAPIAQAQDVRKAGDNPKAVLPIGRRLDALKKAEALLANRPADSDTLVAELGDPFYPDAKRIRDRKAGEAREPAITQWPAQLLAQAAAGIQPTGTMLIGTEPYLLLGGRRYKSGDVISVNVDGQGVQITISSIQRNSYTLRLEDQELRREFK